MSSSLLIILLVIVWLFVLAPMLIRSRNPIRRTGDALAQTRTLYAGGSRRLVPKARRASGEQPDVELDTALFGLPSGIGSTDGELLDVTEWETRVDHTLRVEAAGRRGAAVREALAARGRTDDDTTEIPTLASTAGEREPGSTAVEDEPATRAGSRAVAASGPAPIRLAVAGSSPVTGDATDLPEDAQGAERADDDATVVVDGEVFDRRDEQPAAIDAAGIDDEAELAHRGRRRHSEPVELTDEDLHFAERRRGRGAYDPMADRAAAEDRYRRRRRTAGTLAVVALVSVFAALLTVPALWWVAGAAVVLLVAYLTYLRRQVRLEQDLRRRRVERMRRARLGVESREDAELSVVPQRLRRPGAVVLEVDDEDPAFDHLEFHRPAARAEAVRGPAGAVSRPAARPTTRRDDDHHLRRAVG